VTLRIAAVRTTLFVRRQISCAHFMIAQSIALNS